MAEVGNAMSKGLRETGIGGLAGTPTGRAICEIVTMDNGEEERSIFYGGKPAGTQHRNHCPNCLNQPASGQ